MKTYQKSDGSLWAFEEDGSQDSLLTADMFLLTAAQVEVIRNPPPTLPNLKAAKLSSLNAASEALAAQITMGYPEFEKQTWEDQRRESVAWAANNATPTPYIDSLALYRGIDRVVYLQRTLAKVDAFTSFSAKIIGLRQKYADQIAAATTPEALALIVFNFA